MLGLNKLMAFSTLLAAAPSVPGRTGLGSRIRRLSIFVLNLWDEIDPWPALLILAGAIGEALGVVELELCLGGTIVRDSEAERLDPVLVGALARLSHLRHCTLASADNIYHVCTATQLNRLVPKPVQRIRFRTWNLIVSRTHFRCRLADAWPQLISLRLDRVGLIDPDAQLGQTVSSALGRLLDLRSAYLDHSFDDISLRTMLRHLPKTVSSLSLADNKLHSPEYLQVVHAQLPAFGPQLESLSLLDLDCTFPPRQTEPRGAFDDVLAQLPQLRRLAVGPCAVADLSAAVASLPQLRELGLQQGFVQPRRPLSHAEVALLILRPSSLQRIIIGASISKAWSARGRDVVEEAAKVKGVEVTWLRTGEALPQWA